MDKILAPIKQRILKLIDHKGITKSILFKELDISASNFRGQGLYSEVGGDVITKIASFFPDVNTDWLITGKGSMLKREEQSYVCEPEETYIINSSGSKLYEHFISQVEEHVEDIQSIIKDLRKQIKDQNKRKDL